MPDDRTRHLAVVTQIAAVLRDHWDPIGIKDVPEAADEYDGYVGGVYWLLTTGVTARALAEHLVSIETKMLGYQDTAPKSLIPVAKRLIKEAKRFSIYPQSAG